MTGLLARRGGRDSLLFLVGASPTFALMLGNQHGMVGIVLIAVGTTIALWAGTRRDLQVPPVLLWGVLIALAAAAVARAPMGSHDMWSYAMQGRILEHYHANPYTALPAQFAPDPVLALTGWQHTPSPYGPLFVFFSSAVSRLAGTNLLALRLGFQVPVAVAVLASIWIAMRSRHSRSAAALIGLQPFVWCSVVNGGHNDVFIGLAAAIAVVLVGQRRPTSAAIALALAGLVKPTILLAVPVLLVVLLAQKGLRPAMHALVGAIIPTVVGFAVVPASVTAAARATHGLISRASPWRLLVGGHVVTSASASGMSIALAVLVACLVAWRSRRGGDLAGALALALVTYAVVGSYVLVWYCAWSLSVAAMSRRRAIGVVAGAHGALLFAAYQVGDIGTTSRLLGGLFTTVAPMLTVGAFAWLLREHPTTRAARHHRHPLDDVSHQIGAETRVSPTKPSTVDQYSTGLRFVDSGSAEVAG